MSIQSTTENMVISTAETSMTTTSSTERQTSTKQYVGIFSIGIVLFVCLANWFSCVVIVCAKMAVCVHMFTTWTIVIVNNNEVGRIFFEFIVDRHVNKKGTNLANKNLLIEHLMYHISGSCDRIARSNGQNTISPPHALHIELTMQCANVNR